ncbi:hypothetical protein J1N35_023760 [Gossypium stocksii]|uniref:Uncharacterized protein n=1 Tax=Gossypium stocksii TaxID=47602 RepID=A0A9D3VK59_9ROSI|nr:hypothetical protein J1N35_023760 [Gossypium stocksii]
MTDRQACHRTRLHRRRSEGKRENHGIVVGPMALMRVRLWRCVYGGVDRGIDEESMSVRMDGRLAALVEAR